MKEISVLSQKNAQLLFSIPDQPVYFLLPLSQAERINDLSFEWFEEYLPNTPSNPYPICLLDDGSVRDALPDSPAN